MATCVFFNIPAHGHVNPTVALTRALIERGERVVYYNTREFQSKAESAGAGFRPYPFEGEFNPGMGAGGPFKAMTLILGTGERLIENILPEVRALQPDYVIYDSMCPWGKQIAEILHVPAISSCSIFMICGRNANSAPLDGILLGQMLAGLPTMFLKGTEYRSIATRLKKRYGVSSPSTLDFFANPGDMTLVYTSRYFQLGAERFDESFKFVGPSISAPPAAPDFPWAWLNGAPLIYISLGTLFNNRPEFFRACLQAFGNAPYQVVMSIGQHISPATLSPLPSNFIVRAHNPQLALLEKASLFITHGGMNSASESAWYGVPMIVVPQTGDQYFVAQRVEQIGAGLRLTNGAVTAERLHSSAERVLSDGSFKRQSQAIGQSFRAAGGYTQAAQEIIDFRAKV
jgi:MGT family glycosyltransferase